MGILSNILDKILHHQPKAQAAATAPAPRAQAPAQPAPQAAPTAPTAPSTVDVTAVLDDLAAGNAQTLDWRRSIVDLMKLVGMDSTLAERKQLAGELGYTGDSSDSASMNIWLHKQVIKKLSENGGKVPAELTD